MSGHIIDFLVHGHTNLYMGSGGWDPYGVCQPNYLPDLYFTLEMTTFELMT